MLVSRRYVNVSKAGVLLNKCLVKIWDQSNVEHCNLLLLCSIKSLYEVRS